MADTVQKEGIDEGRAPDRATRSILRLEIREKPYDLLICVVLAVALVGLVALVPDSAVRQALGLVFIASGTLKAAAPPEEFALVIESYGLLSSRDLIMIASAFLPISAYDTPRLFHARAKCRSNATAFW